MEREMRAAAYVALGIWGLVSPAIAASAPSRRLDMEAVNNAALSEKSNDGISPVLIKAQILLDRARFSPGVIDGRDGENMRHALSAFEKAHQLNDDGKLDEEVWARLNGVSSDPVLMKYAITEDDVKGPFIQSVPDNLEEQAHLDHLSYTGPEELLAERFHMDQELLKALNPNKSFNQVGTPITVAKVRSGGDDQAGKAARIEIVKSEHILRVLSEDGATLAVYPASIGSEEKPAPRGTHTVRAIAPNPTYTYNPEYAFKGLNAKEKFVVKAGPNNPVGTVWIDLSIESFGIHGTPDPDKVGKAYSQGCVRLTNWDVEELAKMVRKGTAVTFRD